jgi:hypothetical protein
VLNQFGASVEGIANILREASSGPRDETGDPIRLPDRGAGGGLLNPMVEDGGDVVGVVQAPGACESGQ